MTVEAYQGPPILDFSPFYGKDSAAKSSLIDEIRRCCLHNGFFQIKNHNIPIGLQEKAFDCSKKFFSQPLEIKNEVNKDLNTWNRGYELLRSQMLEAGTSPELKEGYYIGEDISTDHPYFKEQKLNSGPNMWPSSMDGVDEFRSSSMHYYHELHKLARDVLAALALTLDLEPTYFDGFAKDAVATMRYLHYPPQSADCDEKLTRGIGAHTDFGAITLLAQDEVDGLQVWEKSTETWIDVVPVKGAFVVNLGDMFQRWSNDRYVSNSHRVINKTGKERYSIPFFFSGNPDYMIECLPNCRAEGEAPKYPAASVTEIIQRGYKSSYGRAEAYKKDHQGGVN